MNCLIKNIHLFWAISLSEVFGGMGSWNDQYIEDSKDHGEYQEVSAKMYSSLKQLSLALF